MDDATLQRIAKIVDDMRTQGMSDNEIKEQLNQMGLSEEDVSKLVPAEQAAPVQAPVVDELGPAQPAPLSEEHIKPAIEKLEEHGDHLERLHTTVSELHEKTDNLHAKTDDLNEVRQDIKELKASLIEIKSLLASIKTLNTKLLEINNKMLTKLAVK